MSDAMTLSDAEIDVLLERYDQTEPRLQRKIVARFVEKYVAAEDENARLLAQVSRLTAERDAAVARAEQAEAELRQAAWIIQRSGSADLEVKHYAAAFLTRHPGG